MSEILSQPNGNKLPHPKAPEYGLTEKELAHFFLEYVDPAKLPSFVTVNEIIINPDFSWFKKVPDVAMYGTLMSADEREKAQGYMSGVVESSEAVTIPGATIGAFYPENHTGYAERTGDTDTGPWPYVVNESALKALNGHESDQRAGNSVRAELFHLNFDSVEDFAAWAEPVKDYEVVNGDLYTWQVVAVVDEAGQRRPALVFIPSFQQEPHASELISHGDWLRYRAESTNQR
jgi:gamma-glutamylcyclotransferase (GGCT)/AIG2-like uncharacterized protein YtfP